ncbi:alpha/beta hydrolase [Rhodoferax lacus]|uniref:Alpha/beta hydrolase n=1 Tax=Rhodoferax lacus TaxID=2184758 RepID=A0A3E1REN5_9BURK|nr:alpha/beta fold hydrolase BchO [Rhodoferax lacus]RFO97060.1 alpha/beta hydrolase [Rhodoferax lacus]
MWNPLHPPMDWDSNKATWPNAHLSHFVQLPGQTWHVQMAGSGPVLLLLHGTGASTHSWRDLLGPLSAAHTVVCPDLTGHAFTSPHKTQSPSLPNITRNLNALLAHLQLWPQAVIGHSAGAAIGAQLLLDQQQGQRTSERPTPALIGLNPAWLPLHGVSSWLFPSAARLLAMNPLSARLFSSVGGQPAVVRALLQSTGSKLDAKGLELYQRLLQSPGHVHGVLQMMRAWQLDALERALPQLKGPVLMLMGTNDRTLGPQLAERAQALMPQAQVMRFAGLGHLTHEEAPTRTTAQILDWLSQTAR